MIINQNSLFTLVEEKKDLVTQAIEKSLNPHKINVETITFDNGNEFAGHQKIAQSLDAKCFFCPGSIIHGRET